MSRMAIHVLPAVLAMVLSMVSVSQAATIIWVSDNSTPTGQRPRR